MSEIPSRLVVSQTIRLYPNNKQAIYFAKAAGTARFAYNWGLARWKEKYEAGEKPSWMDLNKELNAIKREQFPWMLEITKWAPAGALKDLGSAFKSFFRRIKSGEKKKGYPKFKKKGKSCSFYIAGVLLKFQKNKVYVSKLGWVKTAQQSRFPGRVVGARFKRKAGKWFVTLSIKLDKSYVYPHQCENQAVVGLDLGLINLVTLNSGKKVEALRALKVHEKKLKCFHRELSRRKKGGSNWKKTKLKIQRLYEKIRNTLDFNHKLTTDLVKSYRYVCIEDLFVKGMQQNKYLSKSIQEASLREIRRQLEYKAGLSGSTILVADRWFPSSKKCSNCGEINKNLKLHHRSWTCEACNAKHDRDVNAAINLKNLAVGYTVTALGEGSAGNSHPAVVKLPSMNWESSGSNKECQA